MKITFTNPNDNTEMSISDDNLASDSEIMIECSSDGSEAWHTFKSLKDFDDFAETIDTMRKRFSNHLKG